MESCSDYLKRQDMEVAQMLSNILMFFFSASLYLLHAHRSQPRRSSGARNRPCLQDRSHKVRSYSKGVDEEVCHLEKAEWGFMSAQKLRTWLARTVAGADLLEHCIGKTSGGTDMLQRSVGLAFSSRFLMRMALTKISLMYASTYPVLLIFMESTSAALTE